MSTLTSEQLFERFLWPLYPEDARASLAVARTRDANPAGNPTLLSHLEDAARVFEAMSPALFGGDLRLDRTDASVHRLSVALTAERRDVWASRGTPGTADNELFNVIVHASAYVGACVTHSHAKARWSVRRPLWESVVTLDSRAGTADLAVLQWLLKSLADPPPGLPQTSLADRYRTHVEIPCLEPDALPVFIRPADRRIPRLAKVRYASLHQHLRAHVPEIRDLGDDFPSADRFEAMRFDWLDFVVVGGGRMLLLFGPGEGGAYLVWLTADGFEKSAHFPADAFPAPLLQVEDEKLRLLIAVEEKRVAQEMLWWGP